MGEWIKTKMNVIKEETKIVLKYRIRTISLVLLGVVIGLSYMHSVQMYFQLVK